MTLVLIIATARAGQAPVLRGGSPRSSAGLIAAMTISVRTWRTTASIVAHVLEA
jgi:hypothetical protein